MSDETLRLVEEFAAGWARGESPDPLALLELAPEEERDELAGMLDRYLSAVPAREASAGSRAYVAAIVSSAAAEPPLLAARLERRLTRDALVGSLLGLLGLGEATRAKVRRYVSDLEVGVLDPRGVAGTVWEALGELLGAEAVEAALAVPGTGEGRARPGPYYRLEADAGPVVMSASVMREEQREAPDEVDLLFTGGP